MKNLDRKQNHCMNEAIIRKELIVLAPLLLLTVTPSLAEKYIGVDEILAST